MARGSPHIRRPDSQGLHALLATRVLPAIDNMHRAYKVSVRRTRKADSEGTGYYPDPSMATAGASTNGI